MRLLALVSVCLAASCGHEVYEITSEGKGIPVLAYEVVDEKVTTYEQRWYELDLDGTFQAPKPEATNDSGHAEPAAEAATKDKKAPKKDNKDKEDKDKSAEKTFVAHEVRFTSDPAVAAGLYHAFSSGTKPIDAYDPVHQSFKDTKTYSLTEPTAIDLFAGKSTPTDLVVVSVARKRMSVPSAVPMYVNVHVPAGGVANASIELGSNGTLSKAGGEVQDQLPGKLLDTFSTITSAALSMGGTIASAGAKAATAGTKGPPIITASFKVTPVRRIYQVTIRHPAKMAESACGTLANLLNGTSAGASSGDALPCQASLSIVMKRGEGNSDKDDSDDSIQVQGTVKLPKSDSDKSSSDK